MIIYLIRGKTMANLTGGYTVIFEVSIGGAVTVVGVVSSIN